MRSPKHVFPILLTLALLALASEVGAQTVVQDAQTAMRVRTVLVNDELLGPEKIIVDVQDGQVELSGQVSTSEMVGRAEALVSRVAGVRGVRLSLEIGPSQTIGRDRPGRLPSITSDNAVDTPSRILGLGVGGAFSATPDTEVGNGFGIGPIIRLRPRNGWGPSVGFSWTKLALKRSPIAGNPLAELNVKPVMVGVEYGLTRGRTASAVSLVGGYSFNSLSVDTGRTGPGRAIAVDNAPVLRAGAALWVDVTRRIGVNFFGGYLWVRPRVTFASDTTVDKTRIASDSALLGISVAYWVF